MERREKETAKDEIERLKKALENKDSHTQNMEELRNLLFQQQEKCVLAAREAERCVTEISLYKKQA